MAASVYVSFWALAALIHLTNHSGQGFESVTGWALVVASIWVLLRPTSTTRFVVFAALHVVEVVWLSPYAADHLVLAALVNLVILLRFAMSRTPLPDLVDRVRPSVQAVLLVTYSAAALAKYNKTFIDPDLSCAAFLTDQATFGLTGYGALAPLHLWSTIAAETAIPLLLLFRRTRRAGVILGIGFHLFVSSSPGLMVEDFTFTLIPLFLLFLSPDALAELGRRGVALLDRSRIVTDQRRLPEYVRLGLYTAVAWSSVLFVGFSQVIWILCLGLGVWLLVNVVRVTRRGESSVAELRPPAFDGVPALLLALLVVASPYIGYRTTGSFTMFSNLRTEGDGTNHLFLPSVHLADYQNDLVAPAPESSAHFDSIVANGQLVAWHEIRNGGAGQASFRVVGDRNGQPVDEGGETIERPGWFASRFLHFRLVPGSGRPLCSN